MWYDYFCTVMKYACIFMIVTVCGNVLVDPYDVWMFPRKIGINFYAIRSEDNERLFKPIHVMTNRPDAIFLGNSKCDFALDPIYFSEIANVANVYNMSIRNAQLYEIRKYLELALKTNPQLQTVILGIDYEMFQNPASAMPGFDEEQVNQNSITRGNLFRTTLSEDACVDSLMTLKMNQMTQYDFLAYEKCGKLSEDALQLIFEDEASFYKNTRSFIVAQYMDLMDRDEDIYHEKFQELERIVELCETYHVDLKVFIPPVHAIHMDAYEMYWEDYASWEQHLVDVVPVVDFVSYNDITVSNPEVPIEENLYFWDSGHIKSLVGNMIINRLYGVANNGESENFGILVTPGNVEEHLARIAQQHKQWTVKNQSLKMKLSSMGKFTAECPIDLKNRFFCADIAFKYTIERPSDVILNNDKVLSFAGKLYLTSSTVNSLYAILEDVSGKKYYAMVNKKWRTSEVDLFSLGNHETYDFTAGAILDGIPPGEYSLYVACLLKNHNDAYLIPVHAKITYVQ